jgi:hypothetical protein
VAARRRGQYYGRPHDIGCGFEIAALVVGQSTRELWMDYITWLIKEPVFFLRCNCPDNAAMCNLALYSFKLGDVGPRFGQHFLKAGMAKAPRI